ncbi:hypothetical protein AAC387_Pa07g1651 [Persea americana]
MMSIFLFPTEDSNSGTLHTPDVCNQIRGRECEEAGQRDGAGGTGAGCGGGQAGNIEGEGGEEDEPGRAGEVDQ